MSALVTKLGSRARSDILWYPPEGEPIKVEDLIATISTLPLSEWLGRRIALAPMPTEELAAALIVLDGIAEVLLLLPDEDTEPLRQQRLEDARIDLVLGPGSFPRTKATANNDVFPNLRKLESVAATGTCETTWLLPTSGTTGIPKLIPHSAASLTRSMSDREIGSKYVWSSLYSIRRFAGLQVFLQAWLAGTPLILHEDSADLSRMLERLIAYHCSALSGTPSMWRKLSMHPLFEQLNIKQITLGGEIVDQGVLDMLAKRKPTARLTHIYASTEAGVGFAVRDGLAGFPRVYLESPPAKAEMCVGEDRHLRFRTVRATVDSCGGWLDSGDVVRIEGDRVYFVGRANGSINVGGNKVMPEEVESVIDELEEVSFVQVRARKSGVLGNLVEAAVIPAAEIVLDAALKKKIIAHCRARLEGFKVPAFIVQASEIALTSSGKLTRGGAN